MSDVGDSWNSGVMIRVKWETEIKSGSSRTEGLVKNIERKITNNLISRPVCTTEYGH